MHCDIFCFSVNTEDYKKIEEYELYSEIAKNDALIDYVINNDATQEEVNNVIVKILELVDNKVSLNHIFLTNISSDYFYTLKKLFKMYNIPL